MSDRWSCESRVGVDKPDIDAGRARNKVAGEGFAPACRHQQGRDRHRIIVIEPVSPDTYGLLILAPEAPLANGWLGGDRVVGRAALRDLLAKAARLHEHERQRLSIHLPGRDLTLAWDEIAGMLGAG